MRIAFYPSFRSLDHANTSGLVSIGRDILGAMRTDGHEAFIPTDRSMEWIYLRPSVWPGTAAALWRADRMMREQRPDCWLTYHTYYRAPDIVGPILCRRHRIPYFVLEGSYATKYRKQLRTWPGFQLNRLALQSADMAFVNKPRDVDNMGRLLPQERITFIPPGIRTAAFPGKDQAAARAGRTRRAELGLEGRQVVVTAAMMRPGVKEDGIAHVIDSCALLLPDLPDLHLLIIGDGPGRQRLEERAGRKLPDRHTFAGRIAPADMHQWYQAGDIFAFPGINEAIGMVYLEAQCCGLPVVATSHDGAPGVVADGLTGRIVPPFDLPMFAAAISELLQDETLRRRMGSRARQRVLQEFDMQTNYARMFSVMAHVSARRSA